MSDPLVTVVVPTFNRAAHLERLLPHLERLAADARIEVAIVDDGSTDATPDVLARAGWASVVTQPNGGAAAARNAGWRRATAPIVAFLDDDCTPGPDWPLGLLPAFDDAAVAGVGGTIDGARSTALDGFVAVERLVDHGRSVGDHGVDYLVTANAAFRRATLATVGGFDEGFPGAAGEDVDLSWRVRATGGRLVRSDVAVVHDHRTSVGAILRTYRGHGRARHRLEAAHPDRTTATGSARRALGPGAWVERWRAYRGRGVGPVTSTALVGLRAAGLATMAVGRAQAVRPAVPVEDPSVGPARVGDGDAPPTAARVSVVIPTHQRSAPLDRLLTAVGVCAAPAGGVEVVVVDDGSTDDTALVVARHPWARYVRQANGGAASARNAGWRSSAGEVVAFVDDDCRPDPQWLVELVAALDAPGVGAVGGRIEPLVPGRMAAFVQAEGLVAHGSVDGAVDFLVTANSAFRRDLLEDLDGFDERFAIGGEDTDLSRRARAAGHELALVDGARVRHDHRTSLGGLLRTYQRNGRSRVLLRRHHAPPAGGTVTRSLFGPTYWSDRHAHYRTDAGPLVSIGYVGLHAAGLAAYAFGSARAKVGATRS